MEMTWADKLIEKGVERGMEKGRRDMLQLVLTLLDQRFGKVPRRVQRQVEGIDSTDRLKELGSKVLMAGSLGELGLR